MGVSAFSIQSDFTELDAPEKFIQSAIEKLETVDILINCAAAYERSSLLEIKPETFAWMQKINVEVPLRLIQGFSRYLINEKLPE